MKYIKFTADELEELKAKEFECGFNEGYDTYQEEKKNKNKNRIKEIIWTVCLYAVSIIFIYIAQIHVDNMQLLTSGFYAILCAVTLVNAFKLDGLI